MPLIKIKNYSGECKQTSKNGEQLINGNGTCGGMQACNPVFMFVVKTAILIWILCIVYIIFYIIYRIVRYAYDAFYDYPNDIVRPGLYFLDGFFAVLCYIAVSVLWFLTGVFFILYIVYVIFRAMGLEWLIAMISPWCECKAIGLFAFFDTLSAIFFAPMFLHSKILSTVTSTKEYMRFFFTIVVGMTLNSNYILNNEYFNAFSQLYQFNHCNLNLCPEKVAAFSKIVVEQSPIKLKITIGNDPGSELTQMQTIQIDNCIAKNKVTLPNDASTIDKLTNIFSNEMARRKCYENIVPSIKSSSGGSCQMFDRVSASCFNSNEFSTDTMVNQGSKAISDNEKKKKEEAEASSSSQSNASTSSQTNASSSSSTKSNTFKADSSSSSQTNASSSTKSNTFKADSSSSSQTNASTSSKSNTNTSSSTKSNTFNADSSSSPQINSNTNTNSNTSTKSNTFNAWTAYGNY